MDLNIIVDNDGMVLFSRVPRLEVKRLQEKRMVRPHKKKDGLWFSTNSTALIRQQLTRKITLQIPMAEANKTVRLEKRTSETGQPIRYYEPNFRTCFSYETTAACATEHENRARLPKAA